MVAAAATATVGMQQRDIFCHTTHRGRNTYGKVATKLPPGKLCWGDRFQGSYVGVIGRSQGAAHEKAATNEPCWKIGDHMVANWVIGWFARGGTYDKVVTKVP